MYNSRHRSRSTSLESPPNSMPRPYNYNHRNFNRAAVQITKPTDIMMEAGRLAAEYLVHQGKIPSSQLPTTNALPSLLSRLRNASSARRNRYSAMRHQFRNRRLELEQRNGRNGPLPLWPDNKPVRMTTSNGGEELQNEKIWTQGSDGLSLKLTSLSPTRKTSVLQTEMDGRFSNGNMLSLAIGEDKVEELCSMPSTMEGKSDNDLLQLCSTFTKDSQSSITMTNDLKSDSVTTTKEERITTATEEQLKVRVEGRSSSSENLQSLLPESPTTVSVKSVEDAESLDTGFVVKGDQSTSSITLSQQSSIGEDMEEQPYPEFGGCSSIDTERGEKRVLQDEEPRVAAVKKIRDWPSPMFAEANEDFQLHSYTHKSTNLHMNCVSHDEEVVEVADQDKLLDVSMYPGVGGDLGMEFGQVKQFFPSSFKICDLNFMEAPEVTEIHENSLSRPSTLAVKKESATSIDLSISNKSIIIPDNDSPSVETKEVIIVDVEDDSIIEEKSFDACEEKTEAVDSNLESFSNHTEKATDLPDVQDGVGLMISELLGNDISGCSSMQGDIADLHTEMDLHNGTELITDDDPIYLSLGEIPISMPDI